ncbi:hypothetical protein J5N97_016727 [Dioscorea zingiberensis]|uniref:Uncharacterized protein n=1 Tax=Dioscorea zingiberensis TaxID=325984 RepID=A0A9D5HFY0_9LILI|nr:hypothetical protein J5N97_016727 [Dioscorea zingiberensis]
MDLTGASLFSSSLIPIPSPPSTSAAAPASPPPQTTSPGPISGLALVGNLFQVALQRRPFMYIVRDLRSPKYGPHHLHHAHGPNAPSSSSPAPAIIHCKPSSHHGPLFASRPQSSPTRLPLLLPPSAPSTPPRVRPPSGAPSNAVTSSPGRSCLSLPRPLLLLDPRLGPSPTTLPVSATNFNSTTEAVIPHDAQLPLSPMLQHPSSAHLLRRPRSPKPCVADIESVLKDVHDV